MEREPHYVIGKPLITIFHNADNLFTISKCKITKTNCPIEDEEIVVKGNFPQLSSDESYKFVGELVNHPTYGIQFDVQTFEKELPSTKVGIIQYLSSDLFPGIGKKTAQTIVSTLGEDAIDCIINNPSILDKVPNITEKRKATIVSVLEQNLGLERTMIQLNEWGFGPKIAMRIYQTYRDKTIECLTENPYRLTDEIEGVGFQRADSLGKHLGISGDHPSRIKAAILFTVNELVQSEGHVYVEAKNILLEAKNLLESSQFVTISYDAITNALFQLVEESKLCIEEQRIYPPSLYFSEIGIASKLQVIMDERSNEVFPLSEIRTAIGDIEERLEVTYSPTQIDAIEKALHSPVMILTGGPGTGKTTVIRGFVEVFAELHGLSLDIHEYAQRDEAFPIILVAPTGRAAKRMSESTELPAMTIHRLLGFTGQQKEEETSKEINAKLVIVDEMSMVDTWLAHQLLKALPKNVQILFVGDQDQLPSVGPGQVLKDLLDSAIVPVVELTEIYRQSAQSSIVDMAHMIKRSEWKHDIVNKTHDRSFIQTNTYNVLRIVEQIIENALSKGHHIKDIQVLAPMYRGPAGINQLNEMIQKKVNPRRPNRKEMQFGEVVYRIGDKVLQLVNQPENNVFNGDMGEVISIVKATESEEKKELLVVSYDGIEVTYERKDLHQITLSYCCSIHKAQGSEFPIVIMPIVRGHRKMLKRNLLYTGITRAKNFLILCGEIEEFKEGIHRIEELRRQTTLKERLQVYNEANDEWFKENKSPLIEEDLVHQQKDYILTTETVHIVDPMIGMKGITPYSFVQKEY